MCMLPNNFEIAYFVKFKPFSLLLSICLIVYQYVPLDLTQHNSYLCAEVSAPRFGQNNRGNNARGRGRGQVPRRQQVANTPARKQTAPARPFTRPPHRQPQRVENRFIDTAEPTDTDIEQVEAELADIEQNANENLGPSDIDALLTRGRGGIPRRVPASRR